MTPREVPPRDADLRGRETAPRESGEASETAGARAGETLGYVRVCSLDSSSRIRLAGLPTMAHWDVDAPTAPGIIRLRRVAPHTPGALRLDHGARLTLPPLVCGWLLGDPLQPRHRPDPCQVLVVGALPFETLTLAGTWLLAGLLSPSTLDAGVERPR